MARVHFHVPPEVAEAGRLEEVDRLCRICLMVAKGAQLEHLRKLWEPRQADGKDEQAWFIYDTGETLDIREAVVTGISDMMPGVPMPVCWDHLAGIVLVKEPPAPRPALMQANGALPPEAFRRGRG